MKTEVTTIQPHGILSVGAMDIQLIMQWFSQVSTHDIFISKLRPKSRLAQCPVNVAIEVDAKHIRTMIVKRHFCLSTAEELETIMRTIPIDRRFEMKQAFRLCLNSCKEFESMFKLIVVLSTIKCVRTKVLIAKSSMSGQGEAFILISSLIEKLQRIEIAIKGTCLVTAIAIATSIRSGK